MDRESILEQLRLERDRLTQAIAALEGTSPRRGRRPVSGAGGRRQMSAAGRKRISEAQKARWARQKRKQG